MEIKEFVKRHADEIINELCLKGYISGSENGPYLDHETPVRTTAHWISIMKWLYQCEGEEKYFAAIKQLGEFLLKQHVDDFHYNFYCRRKNGKDHVNGTIGSAWAIEGLLQCYIVLNDKRYEQLAEKVFLTHPFNYKIGLWNRTETDGRVLGYDETFNHQLWFAAAGSQILEITNNTKIYDQVECFLDHCIDNYIFRIHDNGLICHYSCINDSIKHRVRFLKLCIRQAWNETRNKPSLIYKEEGYHYFALFAFAIMFKRFSAHELYSSRKLEKAIKYALDEKNWKKLLKVSPLWDGTGLATKITEHDINIYAFPYNSPAFELPFIMKQLSPDDYSVEIINKLWNVQESFFIDSEGNFNSNVQDKIVLTSRIYELLKAL